MSGLQWQHVRRAHVIDHKGQARRILTLPLPRITAVPEHLVRVRQQVMNNIKLAATQVHEVYAPPLSFEHAESV